MSKFLPQDFDPSRPLALIAGQGTYPMLLAERARAAGTPTRLVELKGETSTELMTSFPADERATVKVGQVGKLLKALKKFDAGYAVMAGQVTPGKLFRGLHPDLKAIRNRGMEAVLLNVLDPNREVKPRFLTYSIVTDDGRSLAGMIQPDWNTT